MFKQTLVAAAVAVALVAGSATAASADTIAVLGDSNSTGHHVDLWAGYNAGLAYSAHMPNSTLVGTWAHDGATSVGTRNHSAATSAHILLVSIGTNDFDHDIARDTTIANIVTAVAREGADETVLVAIPPYNGHIAEAASYNRRLKSEAAAHGWHYVDPWWNSGQKLTGSVWAPGASADGKHPTAAGYAAEGEALDAFLLSEFGVSSASAPTISKLAHAAPVNR